MQPGDTVTVHVSGGPGNTTDWVGLAQSSSLDTSYVSWQYLNGAESLPSQPLADAPLTFTLPATAGSYEFRLFANNGFGRLATSGLVQSQTGTVSCTYIVSPAPLTIEAAGGSGQIGVTTQS